MSSYNDILAAIYTLPVVDTHEHIPVEKNSAIVPKDCLQTYFGNHMHMDLISAGLSERLYQEAMDDSFDLMERFEILEPYFEIVEFRAMKNSGDEKTFGESFLWTVLMRQK